MTTWQWFTVQSSSRWHWVNRKVRRSSSVTRTINMSLRSGFSLRRPEAMMFCSVASPPPANKGKSKVAAAPSYLSSEIMLPENFYTITGDSKLQTEFCSFYTQGSVPVQSCLTAADTHTHTTDQGASSLVRLSLTEASTLLPPNFGQEDNRMHRGRGMCEAVHRCGQMAEGTGAR